MKTKIKVGLPRALLYYKYNILWKTYLKYLGCNTVVSPETNKEILQDGLKDSPDEACLAFKIYTGHVKNLINKCDYILIPRISNYGKNERVCSKFEALYDDIKTTYPSANILFYNIDHLNNHYKTISLLYLGLKLNKNPLKVIYSYNKAIKKQKKYIKELENNQQHILPKATKKILLVAHPYIIYDKYLCSEIITYLNKNKIDILYADRLNKKIAREYYKELSPTLYWSDSKNLVGAINYYKNNISGIIFISTFPCGLDSLVNELMIRKITNIPKLNIIIDELAAETGLITRLESFIDILEGGANWNKQYHFLD